MDPMIVEQATVLTRALGLALIDFLWQGLLVAAVYGVFRFGFRRRSPAFHVVLGQVAMLGFLVLPILGVVRHWGRLSQPATAAGDAVGAAISGASPAFVHSHATGAIDLLALADQALPWVVALWLAGVVVLSTRSGWEWWTLRCLCRRARPLPAQWAEQLRILSLRMGVGGRVQARESPDVDTPMLFGWLRPVILLPVGMVLRLPREQVIPILLHELAHVRRLDYLFNLAELSVLTLLYYHPVVHWLARRLAQDRELACDAMVLKAGANRIDYAAALANLAHEQHALHRPTPRFALAAAAGLLLERISRIVESPDQPSPRIVRKPSWPVLMAALALAAATIAVSNISPTRNDWQFRMSPTMAIDLPLLALRTPFEVGQRMDELIAMMPRSLLDDGPAPRPAAPPVDAPVAPLELPAALPALAQPIRAASNPIGSSISEQVPEANEAAPRPIHAPAPVYPRDARLQGMEGSVSLSFRIDAAGRPADIRIESSNPSGIFDRAARRALVRWRFTLPEAHDSDRRLRRSFDFRLGSANVATAECVTPVGTRICQ
jgi:TonB family protein